jgi:hypothetical protein
MGEMMGFDGDADDDHRGQDDADILRSMNRLLTLAQQLCADLKGGERESVDELRDCLAVGQVVILRLAEEHKPRPH